MYIRTISRKNKNGSITRYVQLAHNERNPVTGTPQAKVLYHFGRADELDMEGLKRLAASIHRFIGEPQAPSPSSAQPASVTLLSSRSLGGVWLLDVNAGIHLTHQRRNKIDPPVCLVSNRFRFLLCP